jgi:hypothetical protein
MRENGIILRTGKRQPYGGALRMGKWVVRNQSFLPNTRTGECRLRRSFSLDRTSFFQEIDNMLPRLSQENAFSLLMLLSGDRSLSLAYEPVPEDGGSLFIRNVDIRLQDYPGDRNLNNHDRHNFKICNCTSKVTPVLRITSQNSIRGSQVKLYDFGIKEDKESA